MRKYKIFCLAALLLGCGAVQAREISGRVTGSEGALPGALVYWAGTTIGVITDDQGRFRLGEVQGYNALVASFVGYRPDTIRVAGREVDFHLQPMALQTEAAVVTATQRGNFVAATGIGKQEIISFRGLTKMACCNLAESFENSAAVTVGYSDAVSGARQIRMLGLTGIYSQLLDESRPVMRGLGTPYGLSYTPGMWLQSIQVSKGVSSVIHGHEAITGQINLEYRKPTDEEPLFLNGYLDDQLRAELNAASSLQINDRLSTVLLAHGSVDRREQDHNHDGFLDVPKVSQMNFANRWLYTAPSGVQLRAGVKYVGERREGGQKAFHRADRGGTERYGSRIDNENLNAYFKAAVPVGKSLYDPETGEQTRSNIALVTDFSHYSQHSFFGLKDYDGIQNSVQANLIYNLNIDRRHTLVTGVSGTLDHYNERLHDRYTDGRDAQGNYIVSGGLYDLGRQEREVGVFAEYNLNLEGRFNFIAGLRSDYHNIYKWIVTPRAHMRWAVTEALVLRGSAGTGARSANPVTDNIGMLATGSRIRMAEQIDRLEKSLTWGGSLTYTFKLGTDERASLSFDYFRTRFSNQVAADQEYAPGVVYLYNVAGHPVTNTWQGDFGWVPFTGFELFATFRYTDTRMELALPGGGNREVSRPLVDKFKGLVNLQYATRYRRWTFDFTAQINGQSRLPGLDGTHAGYEYSPVYPMFFAQVTRKFRRFDVYVGCENMGDYRQKHPVISPERPFEREFNSSVVWGPLMGRKIYAGFRFSLN